MQEITWIQTSGELLLIRLQAFLIFINYDYCLCDCSCGYEGLLWPGGVFFVGSFMTLCKIANVLWPGGVFFVGSFMTLCKIANV